MLCVLVISSEQSNYLSELDQFKSALDQKYVQWKEEVESMVQETAEEKRCAELLKTELKRVAEERNRFSTLTPRKSFVSQVEFKALTLDSLKKLQAEVAAQLESAPAHRVSRFPHLPVSLSQSLLKMHGLLDEATKEQRRWLQTQLRMPLVSRTISQRTQRKKRG